jgi:sigma-E factor negative regulatory protein RseB
MTSSLPGLRRSLAGALCLLIGAAVTTLVLRSPSGAQDVDLGSQYITAARDAAVATNFGGSIEVTWSGPDGLERRDLDVRSENGVLSIGGSTGILVQGPARYAFGAEGWSTMWTESPSRPIRAASAKWDLSVRGGPLVAGRATREVTASDRATGRVVERRSFDAVTGILLRREQFDDNGDRVRSATFTSITLPPEEPAGSAPRVPSQSNLAQPEAIDEVPPGYDVPLGVGDGFGLNGAYREDDGTVQLFYSDGLFSVSVFQQPGTLDRDELEPGGDDRVVAGERVQLYEEPMGTVLVWEGDGVVYTSVSDAPLTELEEIIASFDDEPGALHRFMDYLTGPFAW